MDDLSQISMLTKFMESRIARHQTISSNIANIETPGFKAKDLIFKAQLNKASMGNRDEVEVNFEPEVVVNNASLREDGNSVQLESEMAKMLENSGEYNAAVKLISRRMGILKYSVTGVR